MSTLLDGGGGSAGAASTLTGDWPPFQRRAIKFSRGNFSFTFPANPTQMRDSAGTVATNRPSVGGTVMYIWTNDIIQFTLNGITGPEGREPWQEFTDQCRGKICTYSNALTGRTLLVLVKTVALIGNGQQSSSSWQYQIDCQEAIQFQTSGSATTRSGGIKYV